MSRLGLVATTALVSGCFTSPVNMRPQIFIRTPTAGVFRGTPAPFTASASDPDGDVPTVDWDAVPGDCSKIFPDPTDPSTWPSTSTTTSSFDVPVKVTLSMFCVRARARDPQGATAIDALTITPADHAPTAEIDLTTPAPVAGKPSAGSFPVHTQFVLVANAQDADPMDGPNLTFAWHLKIDTVASNAPLTCAGVSTLAQACFTAAAPGSYDVELDVGDGVETTIVHFPFLVLPGIPPVAHLDVVTPAPHELGQTIELSGLRSMPDLLTTTTFTIISEDGTSVDADQCPGSTSNLKACFTPTTAGSYVAKLEVTSDGGSASDSQPFSVMTDRLPCIGMTDPVMGASLPDFVLRTPPADSSLPYPFSIKSVKDDLDGGDASALDPGYFDWLIAVDAKPFTLRANAPTLLIPQDEFQIGTQIKLRLQIRDRDRDGSNASFATCGDADECHTTVGCFQRWTWTVKFQ